MKTHKHQRSMTFWSDCRTYGGTYHLHQVIYQYLIRGHDLKNVHKVDWPKEVLKLVSQSEGAPVSGKPVVFSDKQSPIPGGQVRQVPCVELQYLKSCKTESFLH